MATRKKIKRKSTRSKKSDAKKSSAKRPTQKRRTPRKSARPKAGPKRTTAKKKAPVKTSGKVQSGTNQKGRNERQWRGSPTLSTGSSGLQSGDLQGLSNVESADSESVDELLKEGNAFEAGVVSGVEESRERDGQEVRTREVPEDDVPGEYLDEE
jgi:hypothetical protein